MKTRVGSRQVNITPEEGLALWKCEIQFAINDLQEALSKPIPTTKFEYFEVEPGDPEYDKAMFEVTECSHPIVFKKVIGK